LVVNTAPPRKRGTYQRGRERREQIALAVLELVDELGHDGVTTAQVAARCGLAEASVLYHYPTKDHLLVAALERMDDFDAELAGLDDEEQVLDLAALEAVAAPTAPTADNRLRLFVMLKGQTATPGHPAAEYFVRRVARQVAVFGRLIADRQRAGLAHPGLDPQAVARQVVALWEGLTFLWLADPSFAIGHSLVDGVRRLTGENWMRALAVLNDPSSGIQGSP
jgi:AcrR family transcriptional regulator